MPNIHSSSAVARHLIVVLAFITALALSVPHDIRDLDDQPCSLLEKAAGCFSRSSSAKLERRDLDLRYSDTVHVDVKAPDDTQVLDNYVHMHYYPTGLDGHLTLTFKLTDDGLKYYDSSKGVEVVVGFGNAADQSKKVKNLSRHHGFSINISPAEVRKQYEANKKTTGSIIPIKVEYYAAKRQQ